MGRTRRLLIGLLGAIALAAGAAQSAQAATGTVVIGTPSDLVRLAPGPLNVSGTIDAPGRLFVTSTYNGECSRTVPSTTVGWLTPVGGQPVEPGAFSADFTYVYGSGGVWGDSDVLCAWLVAGEYPSDPIVAAAKSELRLRRPSATLQVTLPELERDVAATITVSGTAEVARRLDVFRTSWCEDDPAKIEGTRMTPRDGVAVGPGPFSIALSWTPAFGSGQQMFCAFLSPNV